MVRNKLPSFDEDEAFYRLAADAINYVRSPSFQPNAGNTPSLIVHELTLRLTNMNKEVAVPHIKPHLIPMSLDDHVEQIIPSITAQVRREKSGIKTASIEPPNYLYDNGKHTRRRSNQKIYPCNICGISYDKLTDLRKHERASHEPKQENVCMNCGKKFARKDALKRHFDTVLCHVDKRNNQISPRERSK